jgi:hypothetical protein
MTLEWDAGEEALSRRTWCGFRCGWDDGGEVQDLSADVMPA